MTDDQKFEKLTQVALFRNTELYPQPRIYEVGKTLLSLGVNEVAFFKTIRDANIARKVAYKINERTTWDTDTDRFYFLTGHIIGSDNELDLAVQRVNPDSNVCSLVTPTGQRVNIWTPKIRSKHRHYERIEEDRKRKIRIAREEKKRAARARIEALKKERKQKEFNKWWASASPSEKMLYENDQKEMRERLEKLDDEVNTMKRVLGMDKTTFYTSATTPPDTWATTNYVDPRIDQVQKMMREIKELKEQIRE